VEPVSLENLRAVLADGLTLCGGKGSGLTSEAGQFGGVFLQFRHSVFPLVGARGVADNGNPTGHVKSRMAIFGVSQLIVINETIRSPKNR
jgi:hypothetical protein